jgi:hypothetical protein
LENIKAFLQNKLVNAAALGLVLGLTFGLMYGYFINPVEWTDVSMDVTSKDLQEDYLRMAIDSYRIRGNDLLAVTRWQALGEAADEVLETIKYNPGMQGWEAVYEFEKAVTLRNASPAGVECQTVVETNNQLCLFLWAGTTLLLIGLGVYVFYQTDSQGSGPRRISMPVFGKREASRRAEAGSREYYSEIEEALEIEQERFLKNPPLANHIWTYEMGDDQYEESHPIDSKTGDFLGECGIEIAKTMDNSKPKKATAFDIWLFDKNEINTRSIILMSHDAYENEILRTQFEMKGKPILAEIGKEIKVKTDHLLMNMRVLDMICAQIEPGNCEYFQRLSLDVNIWEQ